MNVRNYIHLTGNLGATPTTFVLPSGDLSCRFSLATNEYYRNKEGEKVTRTEWHVVKAYGKLAELFAEHLEKGSQIAIVGSMRYRKWTDKFEQQRLSAEVIASEFTFLSTGRKSATGETTEASAYDNNEDGKPGADKFDAEIEAIINETHGPATQPAKTRRKKKTGSRRSSATATAAAGTAKV